MLCESEGELAQRGGAHLTQRVTVAPHKIVQALLFLLCALAAVPRRVHGRVQILRLCLQRVVLLSYDKETDRISFRHYSIRAVPSGVTKSLKGLLAGGRLPDMHDFADVSEFLTRSGYGSARTLLLSRL